MSTEDRKRKNESRTKQREVIQDRIYEMITSTARQTQRVLDRLEDAGVEVPGELGDRIYDLTVSQLDFQTQMLKSVQESADKVLNRYWSKIQREKSGSPIELVTREKNEPLLVQLLVENPTSDVICVEQQQAECPKPHGVTIKQLPLGLDQLPPDECTIASWVIETKGAEAPTHVRFRVSVKTDLGELARTYELTIL